MPPVGFEPRVSADERPHSYALDCVTTGTGRESQLRNEKNIYMYIYIYIYICKVKVLPDIQCLTSFYHYLYAVDGVQQLDQRRCQMKRIGKMSHRVWGEKTGDCRYIVRRLRVCPRTLLIIIAKALVIGDRILRSLKGMIGRDGHN